MKCERYKIKYESAYCFTRIVNNSIKFKINQLVIMQPINVDINWIHLYKVRDIFKNIHS